MAAADEVPPHHQFLAERRATEHDRAGRSVRPVVQGQGVTAGGLEREVSDIEHRAGCFEVTLVEQHAVFEGRVYVEGQPRARLDIDLRAEQRCECVHG